MMHFPHLGDYLPSEVRTIREEAKTTLQDAFDAADHYAMVSAGSFAIEPAIKVDLTIKNGACVLLPGAEQDTSQSGAERMAAVLEAAGISAKVSVRPWISRFPGVSIVLDEPQAALSLAALLIERLPNPHASRYRLHRELAQLGIGWGFDIEGEELLPRPLSVPRTHSLYIAVHGDGDVETFDLEQDDSITLMLTRLTHALAAIGVDISAQLSRCCPPRNWPCEGPHDVVWGRLSNEAAVRLTTALKAAHSETQPAT